MAVPIDMSGLLPNARAFLADLSENNSREWFNANRNRYDSEIKRPAERLADALTSWLATKHGRPPRSKLFRQHRDMRFSDDKTPFNTHLHIMWSLPDGRAWYLGIATDYATAGAGLMQFETDQLDRWRTAMDGPLGAEAARFLAGPWRVDPPALKRVPAPYPQDHPHRDLLLRKGLVAWADDLDDELTANPLAALQNTFAELDEIQSILGRALS
jgi:uncharacterized protein (TIGR02453 family)